MLEQVGAGVGGRTGGNVVGETTTTGVEGLGNVGIVTTGTLADAVAEPSTGPTLTDALPEIVTPESDDAELVGVLEVLGALEVSDVSDALGAEGSELAGLVISVGALGVNDAIAVEDSVTVDDAAPVDVALVSAEVGPAGVVEDGVPADSVVSPDEAGDDEEIGRESPDVGTAISVGGTGDSTDVIDVLVDEDASASPAGVVAVETAVGTSLLVDTAVGTSVGVVGVSVETVGAEIAVDESGAADVLVTGSEVLVLVALEFCDVDDEDAESDAAAVEVATGVDEALLEAGTSEVDDACEDDAEAPSVEEDEGTLDEGALDVDASVVDEDDVDSSADELTDEGTEVSFDGTSDEEDPAEEVCSGEDVTAVDVLVGAVGSAVEAAEDDKLLDDDVLDAASDVVLAVDDVSATELDDAEGEGEELDDAPLGVEL